MAKTMVPLNLKPHVCGGVRGRVRTLCSAADIEGHCGTDRKVIIYIYIYIYLFEFKASCVWGGEGEGENVV